MDTAIAHGYVDAFLIGPDGGSEQVVRGANTLLYRCADAVAHIFAGVTDYIPVTVGFICADKSTEDFSSNFRFTQNDRTTKDQEDLVSTPLVVRDVRIGQNKQFSVTDPESYSGNKVTLGAMTTENSKAEDIYGILLKDSQGRVLAVKRFDEKITRAKDYAFAVSWSVTFS